MGPSWVLSAPDGPHVGPMNLANGVLFTCIDLLGQEDLTYISNDTSSGVNPPSGEHKGTLLCCESICFCSKLNVDLSSSKQCNDTVFHWLDHKLILYC